MEYPLVAVGGVIFNKQRKVLLVKRKNPPNKGSWAIPGGKVKYGETLEEAVKREIKEETNLDVRVKELLAIVEIIKEGFHYVILDFVCENIEGKLMASSDAEDARFFSLDELTNISVSPTTIEMLKRYFDGEKTPIIITERSTQISK
ncbi:NUDIX hydrolase [Sulfurisphaera tokodaii]|uniref:ADP-ribose pyrophosphatase n=2 Tax=Sulfurisphaera tokodaii TaxID=111955 RepID=F9VPC0_SULTO|nr:NUDIX hydrolase [Sulfurisphaera tokodaii]BAK54767.1 ADP-ribose pyrophosphatase [Sulfurisphaera tokodaii str. 7]HII73163.1 NUDIX hydrolase [Sulfurisphaera tokodaii]